MSCTSFSVKFSSSRGAFYNAIYTVMLFGMSLAPASIRATNVFATPSTDRMTPLTYPDDRDDAGYMRTSSIKCFATVGTSPIFTSYPTARDT